MNTEDFLLLLPAHLRAAAYSAGGGSAWPRAEALQVVQLLTASGLAVCGIEVWIPTEDGPEIPSPYIYAWTAGEWSSEDSWPELVAQVNRAAEDYLRDFEWDVRDDYYRGHAPYFNLEPCSPEDYSLAQ